MGLLWDSHAKRRRDRAEARLLNEERRQLAAPRIQARRDGDDEASLLRQPTVSAVIRQAAKRRREQEQS